MSFQLEAKEIERESARTQQEVGADTKHRIGVHVMSEFIYCPRAGIIAFESKPEDDGTEFLPAPALGGLPKHDIDKIQRGIEEVSIRLIEPLKWCSGLFLTTYILVFIDWGLAVCAAVTLPYWLWKTFQLIRIRLVLLSRLRAARCAARVEPNWSLPESQRVNWWQLQQAGFVSREKSESLVDHALGLAGKPWRVLHRDVWQLPVIRIHLELNNARLRSGELRLQQYARLAAYSYLIFKTERLIAPWAIVLFNRGYEGIAVPIRAASWEAFRDGLTDARKHIAKLERDKRYTPLPPNRGSTCQNCPLGWPVVYQKPYVLNGRNVEPFITSSRNGKGFHSICGDRFRWVPPHEKASEIGLTDQ